MSLESVTMAGNSSGRDGTNIDGPGSLAGGGGVSGPGQIGLHGVLFSANTPQNCDPDSSQITSEGFDIDFPASPCPGVEADPLLGPPANNGGPTLTLLPGAGSPALDRVPSGTVACKPVDQRGVSRPQGSACDIGAVEVVPPASPGGPGSGGPGGGSGGGAPRGGGAPAGRGATDARKPLARIRILRQRLRAALARGLATRVITDEPGNAVLEVFVEGADARRVLAARRVRVARGTKRFAAAGKARVAARFTKAAKRRLRARKRVRFVVRLRVTDLAGNRTTVSPRRTLRR
jgi:hypothetical protein